MSLQQELQEQFEENREIVEALLADGSEADAIYTIEHHFCSTNFDKLEKAAVDAFKLGFEVNDAEEMELEDGGTIFCFDAIAKHLLNVEILDQACEQLMQLADKHHVEYDGWGTYYIGDDAERDEDDEPAESPWH
ncbi:ribonuclease E inhibitor RraB [Shewanella sp. NIFS-20-20]|uniref:ribonuclease E inhibitor RraB n=1 Tax=Shewanella sp. NIFS-20-20 TaxID=2853806 RepID=UPI001C43A1FA|nr:ribonuclease E inhibitor RraB [Shewanella sp. NIFS-20-20]MBV7316200.1 ribonuclease E inhibitor RraB [Shewanella sp. NIFS-20-20]